MNNNFCQAQLGQFSLISLTHSLKVSYLIKNSAKRDTPALHTDAISPFFPILGLKNSKYQKESVGGKIKDVESHNQKFVIFSFNFLALPLSPTQNCLLQSSLGSSLGWRKCYKNIMSEVRANQPN